MTDPPWMLLCNPWPPSAVSPDRFVIDEHNLQNDYDPSQDASTASGITVTDVDELTVLDNPSQSTKLSLNLSMFVKQFFGHSHVQTTQLKTCKARRYMLNSASAWLDKVTAVPGIQDWLEEQLVHRRCKHLWLITGTITLQDAEVSITSSRKTNAELKTTIASLAEMGLPDPQGLSEVGAGIEHDREKNSERSFKVPNEQVFEVQYARVKLRRVKRETKKAYLAGKPRWQQRLMPMAVGGGPTRDEYVDEVQREFGGELGMLEAFVDEEDSEKDLAGEYFPQTAYRARKTVEPIGFDDFDKAVRAAPSESAPDED